MGRSKIKRQKENTWISSNWRLISKTEKNITMAGHSMLSLLWEKLTKEEISQWKNAFKEFDIDGDGTITGEELGKYIGKLGEKFSEQEIQALIQIFDANGDGKLNYEEFLEMMTLTEEKAMIKAFKMYDKDGDNSISYDDVKQSMTILGEKHQGRRMSQMIKEADTDGDGKISLEEFKAVL